MYLLFPTVRRVENTEIYVYVHTYTLTLDKNFVKATYLLNKSLKVDLTGKFGKSKM